ncbi:MAG TPA: long-chain fatty acid--CoA ligase [Candidatus Binatia bacterium]
MNIFDALEQSKNRYSDKDAIRADGVGMSYAQLYDRVCSFSSALAEESLHKGERVALFLPNGPEFLIAYFATVRLGAIAVSLNVMLKRDEVKFIVNDCEATILISCDRLLDQLPPVHEIPTLKEIVCVDESRRAGVTGIHKLLARASGTQPAADLIQDEGAAILYTSGTTGKPKGALLSHGNLVSNVAATIFHTGMSSNDRLICFLPLFHCFGQNFIMNASIACGATLVLHERFQLDDILESIKTHRISMFFGVPAVYLRLLSLADLEERFRSVRFCFSAAAPMPIPVAREWRQRLGRPIYEGYGLTETSPFASYNHDVDYREGSVGTPVENVEMKIVDPEGLELPVGEQGEIAIKGPNVMLGYFRRPEETAQVMRDGWFLTGDIGKRDQDGHFYLVDRAKDMINVSGFKVWPREVEELLLQHPFVSEVGVIGVTDPISGEAVKAFVVLKQGASIREQDLIEYARKRIAVYKAPRFVEFIDALPRNPAGKVLKRELRARANIPENAASIRVA